MVDDEVDEDKKEDKVVEDEVVDDGKDLVGFRQEASGG